MADSKYPTPDHARKGEAANTDGTRTVSNVALNKANEATMEVMDKLNFLRFALEGFQDESSMEEPAMRGLSYILGDCRSRLKDVLDIF